MRLYPGQRPSAHAGDETMGCPVRTAGAQRDATDHNQPLMVWYAAEPVVELDMTRRARLLRPTDEAARAFFTFTVRRISRRRDAGCAQDVNGPVGRTADATRSAANWSDGINRIVGK